MNSVVAPRASAVAADLWAAFERGGFSVVIPSSVRPYQPATAGIVVVGESGDSIVFCWSVEIAK